MALPKGRLLDGSYPIERVVGSGGLGTRGYKQRRSDGALQLRRSRRITVALRSLTKAAGRRGENHKRTVPVDSFEANPWGLYQVHGNVWEWTEDCWNDSNTGNPGTGSERTTGNCSRRDLRGFPGATFLVTSARPSTTGTPPSAGVESSASGWPERQILDHSPDQNCAARPYVATSRLKARPCHLGSPFSWHWRFLSAI
jgi:hypothetical protein